jgi:hypothetical protein
MVQCVYGSVWLYGDRGIISFPFLLTALGWSVLETHHPGPMMSRDGAIQMMLWHESHKCGLSLARIQYDHGEEPRDLWTMRMVQEMCF